MLSVAGFEKEKLTALCRGPSVEAPVETGCKGGAGKGQKGVSQKLAGAQNESECWGWTVLGFHGETIRDSLQGVFSSFPESQQGQPKEHLKLEGVD